MTSTRWNRRSGFCGLEILVMMIIMVIIGLFVGKASQPTTQASSRPSAATSQPAASGVGLKETIRAATVAAQVAKATDGDQPPLNASQAVPEIEEPAPIPPPDVPSIEPAPAEGLEGILEGIFDGL
jgi:hypothetical protein